MNIAAITLTNEAQNALGASVFLGVCILVLVVAVFWILFPILVYTRLGALLKQEQRNGELLEEIAAQGRKDASRTPSSVRYQ